MCPCCCCYWRTACETSALDGVVQPKRVCLAAYPISAARKGDPGEIMRRIKLRAKPKFLLLQWHNVNWLSCFLLSLLLVIDSDHLGSLQICGCCCCLVIMSLLELILSDFCVKSSFYIAQPISSQLRNRLVWMSCNVCRLVGKYFITL